LQAQRLEVLRKRYWERLFRTAFEMSESELRAALKSRSADRRFVATYAVGERLLEWQSELIALLGDSSDGVRLAARRGLVILSFLALNPEEARRIRTPLRQGAVRTPLNNLNAPVDFGPQPGAARAQRQEAARRWQEWWDQHGRKESSLITRASPPPTASEQEQLAMSLTQPNADGRQRALTLCRDGTGTKYTEALILAIGRQTGKDRQQLRDTLATRMARMAEKTLFAYLEDGDAEMRRAAVLGLALRGNKQNVERIIEMLLDSQPTVSRAAYTALCDMTGQDFGPPVQSTEEDRILAAARWRNWWGDPSQRR
jgi:hypothetical protein